MRKDDPNRLRHLLPMDPPRRRISSATSFGISASCFFVALVLLIASFFL